MEAGQLAGDEKEESYVQIEGQLRTGWIYYRQGKLSKALQQIHSGFIASREARNEPLEVEALNKLGWIYNIYDKPEVTKGFYREAERIATKLELPFPHPEMTEPSGVAHGIPCMGRRAGLQLGG